MNTNHFNELSFRVLILSILLTILLAITNSYLALKIGMLTSASIPAAILSMGILRFFKNASIFENNLVQTAASSGEAIAGGVVFSIPALILIHYWHDFPFWQNFLISSCGGILGVICCIPIRKVMVHDKKLTFPEARAIAEVLRAGHEKQIGFRELILGSAIGAIVEILQTGIKFVAASAKLWFHAGRVIFGLNAGFSAAMLGAGYLMGVNIALSLLLGCLIGWVIGVPLLSEFYAPHLLLTDPGAMVTNLLAGKIRYIGIGAMLVAGLWSVGRLLKPIFASIFYIKKYAEHSREERDLPIKLVLLILIIVSVCLLFLFNHILPLQQLNLSTHFYYWFLFSIVLFVIFMAFISSTVAAYFSGLVGVGPSPGSAILIATFAATALFMSVFLAIDSNKFSLALQAITIIIATTAFGAAAIANDNMQDLKVGNLIGATPWKQQLMLILGTVIASFVSPIIMQVLFNVYGIGDVLPHAGMNPENSLAAPPAAAIAALTQAIFHGDIPWNMMILGAVIAIFAIILQFFYRNLSPLAVGIGIYLPLATSTPLIFGGVIAWLVERMIARNYKKGVTHENQRLITAKQRTILLACGLVTGAALMDVLLAIPVALFHDPNIFTINLPNWQIAGELLGFFCVIAVGYYFYFTAKRIVFNKK